MKYPVVTPIGDKAILVNFEPKIEPRQLEKILFYKNLLEEYYNEVKVEIINTYHSLLIDYLFNIDNLYGEVLAVKRVIGDANIDKISLPHLFKIPVCYEPEFAPDLHEICTIKNPTREQIISLHSTPVYMVYFLGFLPGFLYLGGLDEKLFFPRKNEPRMKVEKGSVGIGEKQTGIYPKTSPGGWQIIGKTPVEVFNKNLDPPCEILPGDNVKFYPITPDEFYHISEEVANGNFQLKPENYGS